jgi:predicted CopG family antitoxin
METTTVRIPKNRRDTLKVIASVEKRDLKDIVTELIDEYIDRHRETLDLLSRSEWADMIQRGKEEVQKGIKGKSLKETKALHVYAVIPRGDAY